ncbi:MAG TPA: glycosyltransferase family 4 protein [Pyrinomonadaceae bacterium]|nr:glycosyltransferase family 4 protein [Pyrinomonadaceae bacterium]
MKVLITAPSLNEQENVSGISTLVREIIGKSRAEFVHFEAGRRDGAEASLAWVLKQLALPFRFFSRIRNEKPDVVHINTAFIKLAILRDTALVVAANLVKKPVLLHIHGGPLVMGKTGNVLLAVFTKSLVRWSKKLVVFSERERSSLLARYPEADIAVLPNSISLEGIPDRMPSNGVRTIIFFGRIHHSKGLKYIIEACRVLGAEDIPLRFVCYGAGPEQDWFVPAMTEILGERFSYGGVLSGADKWKALTRADIFFLPSRDEGLPFALLEAMAARCVPVMSDSGAVSIVIEHGRNGFIIEADDVVQAINRLKELLSPDLDLGSFREAAYRTVEERFNIKGYIARLDAIYNEVAEHA